MLGFLPQAEYLRLHNHTTQMARISDDLIARSEGRLSHAEAVKLKSSVSALNRKDNDTAQQIEQRRRQIATQIANPGIADRFLERILNGNDLAPVAYLEQGLNASRAVCRLQGTDVAGSWFFGTGFMIAPRVVMTNHHVISDVRTAESTFADFNYELDGKGNEKPRTRFALAPRELFYSNKQLDFCLIAVADAPVVGTASLDHFGWLQLSGESGKAIVGEYLSIIQHPAGERKQVCVRENKLLKYGEESLWYQADTVPGSSGSPVFNPFWQVVAIHRSGVPDRDAEGNILLVTGEPRSQLGPPPKEHEVRWIANEGVRISRIVAHLNQEMASHPLVQRVLNPIAAPAFESFTLAQPSATAMGAIPSISAEVGPQGVTLVVPLRVPIPTLKALDPNAGSGLVSTAIQQLLAPASRTTPSAAGTAVSKSEQPSREGSPDPDESGTHVDGDSGRPFQPANSSDSSKTYDFPDRAGYNPHFLGNGDRQIDLSQWVVSETDVSASSSSSLITQNHTLELDYEGFSIVWDKRYGQPLLAAANAFLRTSDTLDSSRLRVPIADSRVMPNRDLDQSKLIDKGSSTVHRAGSLPLVEEFEVLHAAEFPRAEIAPPSDVDAVTNRILLALPDSQQMLWRELSRKVAQRLRADELSLNIYAGRFGTNDESAPRSGGWKLICVPWQDELAIVCVIAIANPDLNSLASSAKSSPLCLKQVCLQELEKLTGLQFPSTLRSARQPASISTAPVALDTDLDLHLLTQPGDKR